MESRATTTLREDDGSVRSASSANACHDVLVDWLVLLTAAAIVLLPLCWSRLPTYSGHAPVVPEAVLPALRIDVNDAAWYQWSLLDGIGEARGRSIVTHRRRLGGFRHLTDLESVPGMPRGWVRRLQHHLILPSN